MSIIKHLKRLGATVRDAVTGRVCSFDKDGNVISTAKYIADMPGHPAAGDAGKAWMATGAGAASWKNVPGTLPAGGNAGDFLVKTSDGATWGGPSIYPVIHDLSDASMENVPEGIQWLYVYGVVISANGKNTVIFHGRVKNSGEEALPAGYNTLGNIANYALKNSGSFTASYLQMSNNILQVSGSGGTLSLQTSGSWAAGDYHEVTFTM